MGVRAVALGEQLNRDRHVRSADLVVLHAHRRRHRGGQEAGVEQIREIQGSRDVAFEAVVCGHVVEGSLPIGDIS
jgi:hypothetical protein